MNYLGRVKSVFVILILTLASCEKKDDGQPIDDIAANFISSNNLIKEVIEEVKSNYADDIEKEKLEIGAVNGILKVLDNHSTYITQDEFDAFNKCARGVFLGIGIDVKQEKEGLEIISVIDESPAAISGLKALDVITRIDGKDVLKTNIKDIISRLNSDYTLNVKISVLRNKTETLEFKLKKSVIQLPSVKLNFIDDIALIKITHFNEETLVGVSQAIKALLKKKSTGVIIDLRNNPGGILEQAVNVCDLFLSDKKIVEFQSKHANENKTVQSDDNDLLNGLPMVVLVNSKTASGGELVAAALKDNKRAVVLGEKTYGKGSLQTIIPIPGRGAIKLTTAYFVSPNGNVINQVGVMPDVEIADTDLKQTVVKKNSKSKPTSTIILRAIDILHGVAALNETPKSTQTPQAK
ncbi:MAG: S41 family peptidase [Holosporales bacterium]|jgi:carboxyl-terminal processing protease|nr:S41 family peptidase [Holosporales bacterium]